MGVQIILLLIASFNLLDYTNGERLDTVDSCLLTCDFCFKGEVLLGCANECLRSNKEGMSSPWSTVCPYFKLQNFLEH